MRFAIQRFGSVDSTNRLAADGKPGDVFVAAEQSAGRGRLDHTWQSRSGENLLMSAVLGVSDMPPAEVATFPLVAGLAVVRACRALGARGVLLKWPNDVYLGERKVCGILCERHGDRIVAGIGVNVRQTEFPAELAAKATSLWREGRMSSVDEVLEAVLTALGELYEAWRRDGFAALHPQFASVDFLAGRDVTVLRTDDDPSPLAGRCRGMAADGSLLVGDARVYAGEVRWQT